jgi:uncharacterized protein YycO
MKEGDIVLFHGPNFYSRLIRFGQALRFRGDRKRFAHWNHVAIVVGFEDDEPVIVEAVSEVRKGKIWDNYNLIDYEIEFVSPLLNDSDRLQVIDYCNRQVGDEYDWVEIISLAVRCLFGGSLSIKFSESHICSGLVGEALERAGYDFGREASDLMPADIAEFFGV